VKEVKVMLKWVEPFIWKCCGALGNLMTFVGLLVLLTAFCILTYRGTEALIEKGEHDEDQD
jgi:predicted transporter